MRAQYENAEGSVIKVVMLEGEAFTNTVGPAVCWIPVDEGNADYQSLVVQEIPIDPFVPPATEPVMQMRPVSKEDILAELEKMDKAQGR